MNWTFKLIPITVHIPFSLYSHYFFYSLCAYLMIKDREEKLFDCIHNNIISSDEYITWIPEWHTDAQKEYTFFTYMTAHTFTIHHRFAAITLTMNKKKPKRRRRKEWKRRRRKKKVYDGDDGSDIFTQPHRTNRTIKIRTHTKNNTLAVRRDSWKRKRYGFSLLFVLMQKYDDSCW